jgi:hypothetical protein
VELQSKAMAAIQDDEFVAVRSLIIPQQTIDSSAVPTVKETTVLIMHSLCFFTVSVLSLPPRLTVESTAESGTP